MKQLLGIKKIVKKDYSEKNLVKKLDGHFMVMNLLAPKWSRKYFHD